MTLVDPRIDAIRAAYRTGGPKAYWQKVKAVELEAAGRNNKEPSPITIAFCQVGVGDKDAAIETLQKAVANGRRDIAFAQLKAEPAWDPIRPDPRFQELIKKIGFPE
jgi:hypothetical protein